MAKIRYTKREQRVIEFIKEHGGRVSFSEMGSLDIPPHDRVSLLGRMVKLKMLMLVDHNYQLVPDSESSFE